MNSAIFQTGKHAYQVSHIGYAGSVQEIPQERRKNTATHSFKIITTLGAAYCYFTSQEAAWKARGALAAKIDATRPSIFKHGTEVIDPRRVVAFGSPYEVKNPTDDKTHAFIVTMESVDGERSKVFLTYRSEENAKRGRGALMAAINTVNNVSLSPKEDVEQETHEGEVVESPMPF